MANEKEKAVTPPAIKEVVITGIVRTNPVQGKNGQYQQTVKVEGESLTTLNAEIGRRRAKGEFSNSPTIVYGTPERGYYVYVPVAADVVANPKGSGRQIDNVVTLSLADRNGWARVMASVSADIKAKNDAKKAATLAAEAEKLTEMQATVSLFSKLGLNKQVVALQLLSEKTDGTLDVAAVFTALQNAAPAPVSRSSKLSSDSKEEKKRNVLAKPDEDDLDGEN